MGKIFFHCIPCPSFYVFFFKDQLKWTENPKLQFYRGLTLFFANICFFYSISILSMAKALTLAFVAPLITTTLSPLFLGEKVGIRRWTAVIVGFLGILVVIRPGFIEFNLASFAAVGTGCFYGIYLIITRKLHSTDSPLLTLLLTGVVGVIIGSFIVPVVWVNPTFTQWCWLTLMGLFACLGHILLIYSLKYADASKLAPFGYIEIVPNIILGYYLFNDFLDLWSILGLLIIIFSGLYVIRREYILKIK